MRAVEVDAKDLKGAVPRVSEFDELRLHWEPTPVLCSVSWCKEPVLVERPEGLAAIFWDQPGSHHTCPDHEAIDARVMAAAERAVRHAQRHEAVKDLVKMHEELWRK